MHPGSQIEVVYLCREPVDFRKSISGLSALVEQGLGMNPFDAALHVFINAKRDKIKALYWHRNVRIPANVTDDSGIVTGVPGT